MLIRGLAMENFSFPPVESSLWNGIVAVGGDLSPGRIVEAYRRGIFPWYSENEPIIWWSPNPRFVLFPGEIRIAKTMKPVLKKQIFHITYDSSFAEVIHRCSLPRRGQPETWITRDMAEAYCKLHEMGYAHSVEAWHDGMLAGGLYGLSLGGCFFGESMFSLMSNSSKAALITLVRSLAKLNFTMIDCQVYTEHLKSLGARHIPREEFIRLLGESLCAETIQGSWSFLSDME